MSTSEELWREAILPSSSTIQQAIENLDEIAIKIVLVVNKKGELLGTISDGDIRRGLLKGLDLSSSVKQVFHADAFVVPPEMSRQMIVQLMIANKIQQIPIVDERRHVVGLHLWNEIANPQVRNNAMVIMAGGRGERLIPHTQNCPKPMLPVAGRPMLEHIIERAKAEGFKHFVIAVHYLGNMIEDYFGCGDDFGVKIDYLREDTPLGTAGALSLFSEFPSEPFIVTNGDVLTDIRYGELLDFHFHQNAMATMAVRLHEWEHPFGVVKTEGVEIVEFVEKPLTRSHINAGVYALSPEALERLELGERCDMPTLFERLQSHAKRIVAYPMYEPWMDVGRPDDLTTASDIFNNNSIKKPEL